jgi:hypothetical protein
MKETIFDPMEYYSSYPGRIIFRPGYPARAQYKSTLMWDLYGKYIMRELGQVNSYADIGGCFGFGANAMAFHISKSQNNYPETKVFEIASDFITTGKQVFPYIDFIQQKFNTWEGNPSIFDLVTLFDVIEHVSNPEVFLSEMALRTRLALLNTPMETTGEWLGGTPPTEQGENHPDGHINFFTPKSYVNLLKKSGLEIVSKQLVPSIVPFGTRRILAPEISSGLGTIKSSVITALSHSVIPYTFLRKVVGGGNFLCLVKSVAVKNCQR